MNFSRQASVVRDRLARLAIVAISMLLAPLPAAQAREIPAFPGAEGWGTTTPGGRNGKILFVTSLADRGPGTLREALLTKGPRTILFRTSGIIRLEKPLWVCGPDFSYATVAGQSAPGGGMPDEWETAHRLRPADPSDCWADTDKDGYGNLEEFLNGTDPRKANRQPLAGRSQCGWVKGSPAICGSK